MTKTDSMIRLKFSTTDPKNEEDLNEISDAAYHLSEENAEPYGKRDPAMTLCGILSLICLLVLAGVSIFRLLNLFGLSGTPPLRNLILCFVYLTIAILLLPKKLQYLYYRLTWKSGFKRHLNSVQSVTFYEDHLSIRQKEQLVSYPYRKASALFKIPGKYYVLEVNSEKILVLGIPELEKEWQETYPSQAKEASAEETLDGLFGSFLKEYPMTEETKKKLKMIR
ncbi:MAG: hypothetical protein J5825_06795 [Lachnospiraceae bacterium]|nr:hypothetical protein [Lachnospiraceae bacterium]